jgi:exopolysaccharide biosynthesis polyprenyl glycosylphosphotransferase
VGTRILNTPTPSQSSSPFLNFGVLLQRIRQNTNSKMRAVRLGVMAADLCLVALAFWTAYNLRFENLTSSLFDPGGIGDFQFYRQTVFFLIPLWIVLFWLFKAYDHAILFSGHQEYTSVFTASTVGIMLVIVVIFLDPQLTIARGWLLLTWVFSVSFVGIGRFLIRRLIYMARRRGHFMTPTYIVGANAEGIAIAGHLMSAPQFGINVIGFLDDSLAPGETVMPDVVVHGPTDRAEMLCAKFGVERLIVATSGIEREELQAMFKRFVNVDDVAVWLSSGMYEMLTTGVRVQDIGSMAMISVNRVRLNGLNVVMKAIIDYVGAAVALVLLSPLLLYIYWMMKRTDPGPVLYKRRVVGVGGKQFDAFKFRTMVVNSSEVLAEYLANNPEARAEWDKYEKLRNDPRVTKIGAFLRKTSLDELPQLFNVLRGEMSLVGPRMITLEEVERYGQWDMNIHTVKPGITGLWQISGRSELTYAERVRLDMHYIRNYSIWLDLQILFWTIPTVVFRRGAF